MKPIRTLAFSILVLAGTVLSTSCWTWPGQTATGEAVEMKSYKVPAGQQDRVRSMLRYALDSGGENAVGQVSTGPGNTLLVVAPPKIQEGVASLVKDLESVRETPQGLSQVTTSYWMIVGRPLQRAPADGRGYVVSGDSPLDAVAPALETIVEAQGPTEFSLMEQIRITALDSDEGRAHGKHSIVQQLISDVGGRITGHVQLMVGQNQLETRVALEPGQLLVMGQVGYRGPTGDAFDTDGSPDITLYYVMAPE